MQGDQPALRAGQCCPRRSSSQESLAPGGLPRSSGLLSNAAPALQPEARQALTSLQAAIDGLPNPDAALSMVAAEVRCSRHLQLSTPASTVPLNQERCLPAGGPLSGRLPAAI